MTAARVAGVLLVLSTWSEPLCAQTATQDAAMQEQAEQKKGENPAAPPSASDPVPDGASARPSAQSPQTEAAPAASPLQAIGPSGSGPSGAEPGSQVNSTGGPATPPENPPPAAGVSSQTPPPPSPILIIRVDLARQEATVIEKGKVRYVWPISSGVRRYPTETGEFTPVWTSRLHYSKQWDNAPMPYAIFFNRGTAFHGTYATRSLGRPASHGCIRLANANAKKLYNLVNKYELSQTQVIVFNSPFKSSETVARADHEPRRTARKRSRKVHRAPAYAGSRSLSSRKRRYAAHRPPPQGFFAFWD